MKILIVFANPRGTSALRLGEEDRTIQECIRRSKNRDNLTLTIHHAATIDDVRRALLDDEYEIVHFSGHGTGTGLALEDKAGQLFIPPQQALADLLAEFSPPIKCLLLNACYSMSQGEFTSLGVPYTIAMEGPVSDDAAILFAAAFYDSIGAGKDPEFSFRQGIYALRLASHPDALVPHLLKKGEFTAVGSLRSAENDSTRSHREQDRSSPSLLVGIALDVSGSMEKSIKTSMGREQTRLKGFTEALAQSIEKTKGFLESGGGQGCSAAFFAYAFGMRAGEVCDLFSLLRISSGIITHDEIEQLKARYTHEIEQRYAASASLGDLAGLARSVGLGGLLESAKRTARANAEEEVRNRIMSEVQRRLAPKLQAAGDTTLDINELAKLWNRDSSDWENASVLIFGNTPMKEALTRTLARFKSELLKRASLSPVAVLALVSDGEPTDGDPIPLARAIRDIGVTIISCFITDRDLVNPRTLYGKSEPIWTPYAQTMFEMASEIPDDSPLTRYLLRNGWSIQAKPKAFIQANHSRVLHELMGMAMSPVEAGQELLPKGI